MAEASRQQALASMKSFLTTGDYSDLVITCCADSYNVHKVVVCSRAAFFARALKFGGKEATEGKIDLPEEETDIIKLLVQYLYEGEYEPLLPEAPLVTTLAAGDMSQRETVKSAIEDPWTGSTYSYDFPHNCNLCRSNVQARFVCSHHACGNDCNYRCGSFICDECTRPRPPAPSSDSDQLLIHAKMYEIADKYDVVGLKDLVQEKFKRACGKFWNDDNFPIAANHAFSTTLAEDKGLRDIVSATISDHRDLLQKPEIQALMTEFNGLALGILLKMVDEQKK